MTEKPAGMESGISLRRLGPMTDDYDAADIASLARDLIVAGRSESYAWTVAESFVAERKRRQEVVREQDAEVEASK